MKSAAYQNFSGQQGVTLAELLVVIVVIVILSTFALMQRGAANEQFKRQNVARELKVAFERARFDSVKRRATGGAEAKVEVTATTYTLTTDLNQNGTFETGESVVTNFGPQDISITGYTTMTLPVTVMFNQRGEAAATSAAGPVNPQFLICNGTCTPVDATVANANIVLVTPTGTVNMLAGNAAPPTFAPANGIANVTPSTAIRPIVSLP